MKRTLLICALLLSVRVAQAEDIPPMKVLPTPEQLTYMKQELIGFIHYTVNAFTGREWGEGTEDPSIFNPSALDTRQWAAVAKMAGMKTLILTAKHHDGFCLWPSAYTDHSVKSSPYKDGKGDIVGELAQACKEQGLRLGIYLSPWDRHEPKYGTNQYNQYYLSQLRELMSNYGEIAEVWMDGAKGKDAADMEYDFNAYRTTIYRLQPHALIFSDAGPDIRWIGNERAVAGETFWPAINNQEIMIGGADQKLLNMGDPHGAKWVCGECDVSIRPGWFYHADQDDQVKTPQQLMDIYYTSVGRNCVLLLNLPPDKRGLIHENDVAPLKEFRSILDETFKTNLAAGAKVTASNVRDGGDFAAAHLTDADLESYWAPADGVIENTLTVALDGAKTFDRVMLQEPVRLGQRVSKFHVDVRRGGVWETVAEATTIGYKRILRIAPIEADAVRVVIEDALAIPALSNLGLYRASPREAQ